MKAIKTNSKVKFETRIGGLYQPTNPMPAKEPKDLIQYHYKAMEAFHKFLKDEDKHELMFALCSIQRHYRSERSIQRTNKKSIWFRFFSGDTLAWTIDNIMHDLANHNRKFIVECMQICVDTGEIEVYYS